jgi:hypothetical protein
LAQDGFEIVDITFDFHETAVYGSVRTVV